MWLKIILAFSDSLAVVAAFFLAYFLRNVGPFRLILEPIQPIEVYIFVLPVISPVYLLIIYLSGLYEDKNRLTAFAEINSILRCVCVWVLFLMAGSYLQKVEYSRLIVFQMFFYVLALSIIGRLIIRDWSFVKVNIAVLGTGFGAREIAKRLSRYKAVGYHFVGFIKTSQVSRLGKIVKQLGVDEIYIADPKLTGSKALGLLTKHRDLGVKFKLALNVFPLITGDIDIADLEKIPALDLSRANYSTSKVLLRGLFDIFGATILLAVTFPVWIIVAILIRLDSPGEVFFCQKRVGYKGETFNIYKFRTMKNERVTRIGKVLRRTSLDELPQLLNIFKGEMSLVGPRPEIPAKVKKYSRWERQRLMVKPGLTGLWQILGRKDLPLTKNLEYDFYYINNQSILLDLAIIFKTIPLVLSGKGAY